MEIISIGQAVEDLIQSAERGKLNLSMSGDPHYQPKALKPYLGYDQRVKWQILVEWFWMCALAQENIMPKIAAKYLTRDLLRKLLSAITTTKVTKVEREITKHDILALLRLMRKLLPKQLHDWLHLCATSYDIISTAYALQFKHAYAGPFFEQAIRTDKIWRERIEEGVSTVRMGMTHLQDALPVTIGRWLAVLHSRFISTVNTAEHYALLLPGKFSGAVGTSAASRVLLERGDLESKVLGILKLPRQELSTQIPPPEPMQRFLNELFLLSGVLANLGEDGRILQSSPVGEITSASSTSSTMSHKKANPIAAENMAGMHASVAGEVLKSMLTLSSNLERDLRWSNVMRGFGAVMVFAMQQLVTAERFFKTMSVNKEACARNFKRSGNLVVAELLHLSLQRAGLKNAHTFVNEHVVPAAVQNGATLKDTVEDMVESGMFKPLAHAWRKVPKETKEYLGSPERYLGDSVEAARSETNCRIL